MAAPTPTPEEQQQMIQAFIQSVRDRQVITYAAVPGVALLAYDYLLTMDLELKYIWPTKMSLTKFMFFSNRYLIPLALTINVFGTVMNNSPSRDFCVAYFRINLLMFTYGVFAAQIILVLRVISMWSRNKWIAYFMWVVLFIGNVLTLTFVIVGIAHPKEIPVPPGINVPGCKVTFGSSAKFQQETGVGALLVDFVVLVFTIGSVVKQYREHTFARGGLLALLVRDGLVYFVCVFGLTAANVIILHTSTQTMWFFMTVIYQALQSILINRLSLNVRKAFEPTGSSTNGRGPTGPPAYVVPRMENARWNTSDPDVALPMTPLKGSFPTRTPTVGGVDPSG